MQEQKSKQKGTRSNIREVNYIGNRSKGVYCCPYEECKKTFTESGNLKTHVRTHVSKIL